MQCCSIARLIRSHMTSAFSQTDSAKLWLIPPMTVSWGTAWGCTWPCRMQLAELRELWPLHPSRSAPAIPPVSQKPLDVCSTVVVTFLYICQGIFYAGSIINKTSKAHYLGILLIGLWCSQSSHCCIPILLHPWGDVKSAIVKLRPTSAVQHFRDLLFLNHHRYPIFFITVPLQLPYLFFFPVVLVCPARSRLKAQK